MGKFRQILTELSARDTSIFSFPDNNLSKRQGILTKLGTHIDMKDIWSFYNWCNSFAWYSAFRKKATIGQIGLSIMWLVVGPYST